MSSPQAVHWIQKLAHWLADSSEPGQEDQQELRTAILQADVLELESLLGVLSGLAADRQLNGKRLQLTIQWIAANALQRERNAAEDDYGQLDADAVAQAYSSLKGHDQTAAAHLLQLLSAQADDESLDRLAEIIGSNAPDEWNNVGLALSPLWQSSQTVLETFFAALALEENLDAATLPVLLDLSNFSVRTGKLQHHPFQDLAALLAKLLRQVTYRLEKLQSDPSSFGDSVESIQQILNDSIALTVSLCDSLGIIGGDESVDALTEAVQLSHRRIQVEAAGALASLGIESGKSRLLELAVDPAARLRAVRYAEDLGLEDELPSELRHPNALAESELALWLSSPEQFGLPPTSLELIDTRNQYWPSYEEPQNCFLFQFEYRFPESTVRNVGIAGPLTHAFQCDLAGMPVEDIYAIFAGWHAEHEEIFEVPAHSLNEAQLREANRLANAFEEFGLGVQERVALTLFFGEVALLAVVRKESRRLLGITDGHELICLPVNNTPTSISPETILCLYRGRKLLRTFNA